MGWLTIALCFSALAASQGEVTPEPPTLVPFDEGNITDPTMFVNDEGNTTDPTMFLRSDENETTDSTMFTLNYDEKVEDVDEEDVVEDDEDEMEPLRRNFVSTNPKEVDGQPLFEGDMLLTQRQWRAVRERKGIADTRYRWPEVGGWPLVPFVITDRRVNIRVIWQAIHHWQTQTCIRFQPTTNTNQPHLRFIYGNGCYSQVGRIFYSRGQDISIGQDCDTIGVVAHEIGHAIGFQHEQSRRDRYSHIAINTGNIDGRESYNFYTYNDDPKKIEYDYSSLMHYGPMYFSINGKSTMFTKKDPLAQAIIGQDRQLSHRDIHLANIMYRCTDKWLAACRRSSDPCQNGGYLGSRCLCVCPPGTSGANCERRTGGYYDRLRNSCTQKITRPGTVTSPNYPNNYPVIRCVKLIEAPACHVPQLYFYSFYMHPMSPDCFGGRQCCYYDALEILEMRNRISYHSKVYCAADIKPGTIITGTTSQMTLFFRTASNFYRGFAARLTFKKIC